MRVMTVVLLGATAAACAIASPPAIRAPLAAQANSVDSALQRQREEQRQQDNQIIGLYKPLASCVRRRALELSSSPESADIAGRAAVGRCSKEEYGAYRSAVLGWGAMSSFTEANAYAQATYEKLVEQALTIIVSERQRRQ